MDEHSFIHVADDDGDNNSNNSSSNNNNNSNKEKDVVENISDTSRQTITAGLFVLPACMFCWHTVM